MTGHPACKPAGDRIAGASAASSLSAVVVCKAIVAMKRAAILGFPLFCALTVNAQNVIRMPRRVPGKEKPTCSPGAICFSGKVSAGEEFRKTLNADLEFVLKPGWNIAIAPKRAEGACNEFA